MMMPLDAIGYQGTPQNSRLIFLTTKFTKHTKSRMNHTDLQNPHEHRIYANSSPRFPWMIFVCFVVPFSVLRSAHQPLMYAFNSSAARASTSQTVFPWSWRSTCAGYFFALEPPR